MMNKKTKLFAKHQMKLLTQIGLIKCPALQGATQVDFGHSLKHKIYDWKSENMKEIL